MDFLFIDSRDPIFGLIVLVFSILLVVLLSYFWGILSTRQNNEQIDKFLQKFATNADKNKILDSLDGLENSELISIADGLAKMGDWHGAIVFYEKIIKKSSDTKLKTALLAQLANAYIKTGFLERAKQSLCELLRVFPRDEKALFSLIFVCEKLRDFSLAKESLEALQAISGTNDEISAYLNALEILSSQKNASTKLAELEKLSDTMLIRRFILELSLELGRDLEGLKLPPLELCIDLLGLSATKYFKEDLCNKNAFNLRLLKECQNARIPAKLEFSYTCKECSTNYPLFFARCPKCLKIASIEVSSNVIFDKEKNEKNQDF